MAVKHLSYKDLPLDLRRKGAAEQRARLAVLMSHPFATPEQKAEVLRSMEKLDLWERGLLPEPSEVAVPAPKPVLPPPTPIEPVAHEVVISEKLSVKTESLDLLLINAHGERGYHGAV